MAKTTVGLFENIMAAERVVSKLGERGFPAGKIQVLSEPLQFNYTGPLSARHAEFEGVSARELERIGATRLEAEAYLNGLRHGGTLVIATSSDNESGAVVQIMNRAGAFDVEELIARNRILSAWYSKDDTFPRRV